MILNLLLEFWEELKKQRVRAFLTLSAMSWGTFTITTLLAFGSGLGYAMYKGTVGSGNNIMQVFGGQTNLEYKGMSKGRPIRLTEEDAEVLRQAIPQIDVVSPTYGKFIQLKTDKNVVNTFAEGVNQHFEDMRTMYPAAGGRFLNQKDMDEFRRSLVLGTVIAEQLFGQEDPVGKQVMVDGQPFTVVGIIQNKPQTSMSMGPDSRRAIIPYTTFRQIYGFRFVRSLIIHLPNSGLNAMVKNRVYEVMGKKYQFDPKDKRAIGVWDMIENMKMTNLIFQGFNIFLGIIGGLTLIVAGVGIANIMYVIVKERTREIGIRKALGAKKIHISSQFILESLLISFIGGLIGLLITFVLVKIAWMIPGDPANSFSQVEMLARPIIHPEVMFMVVGILTLIGLFAGYFPARKAASVHPIESLRYE